MVLIENEGREIRNGLVVVAIMIVAISVSPRLPLPIDISGRLFEIRLEDLWLAILLPFYACELLAGARIYVSRLFLPIVLWQGYGVLLTIAVVALNGGELLRVLFYTLKELEFVVIFLITAHWIRSLEALRLCVNVLLAMGVFNVLWGAIILGLGEQFMLAKALHSWLLGGGSDRFMRYGMVTFGEASAFGVCMYYIIVSYVAMAGLAYREKHRWMYVCIYIIASLGGLMTGEKISLILIGLGLALFFVLRGAKMVRFLWPAAILVPASMLLFDFTAKAYPALYRVTHLHAYKIQEDRLSRWRAVVDCFLQNPFYGHGKGGVFYLSSENSFLEEYHNYYLKIIAETGVIGIALFLFFVVSAALIMVDNLRYSRSAETKLVTGAAFASLVGLLIAAIVQDAFKTILPNGLFWLILGLAAASWRLSIRGNCVSAQA